MTETRLYFTKNDGYQTIFYSLITVIFYGNIQHLQKMTNTKLYYIAWLPSFNMNGSFLCKVIWCSLSINEPLVNNDGYQTKLYSLIPSFNTS